MGFRRMAISYRNHERSSGPGIMGKRTIIPVEYLGNYLKCLAKLAAATWVRAYLVHSGANVAFPM